MPTVFNLFHAPLHKKLKVFICSDMEGIAEAVAWEQCYPTTPIGRNFAKILTDEVRTICDVLGNGAEIVIRDSHGDAKNINPDRMKKNVRLIQYLDNNPLYMMLGIDASFDCCILHGFHAADGSGKSPLAHTFLENEYIEFRINGDLAGEGTFSLYTAAYFNVPLIYMSGDSGAVEEVKRLSPNTITTVSKDFEHNFIMPRADVCALIKSDLTTALNQFEAVPDIFKINLPESFHLKMTYRDPMQAKMSANMHPGLLMTGSSTIEYQTDDWFDLLVAVNKLQKTTRMKYSHWRFVI